MNSLSLKLQGILRNIQSKGCLEFWWGRIRLKVQGKKFLNELKLNYYRGGRNGLIEKIM